jgi:hypothetical protein
MAWREEGMSNDQIHDYRCWHVAFDRDHQIDPEAKMLFEDKCTCDLIAKIELAKVYDAIRHYKTWTKVMGREDKIGEI